MVVFQVLLGVKLELQSMGLLFGFKVEIELPDDQAQCKFTIALGLQENGCQWNDHATIFFYIKITTKY